jgi:CHAT domain-containing protein
LHQLPFESLVLPERYSGSERKIRYVVDELPPIRYGPSLSVLAGILKRPEQKEANRARLLTVGNPAYPPDERQNEIPSWRELFRQIPSQRENQFPPLVHSEAECESVYASFDELPAANRIKLVNAAATEAAVREHIATSRFIHIAAHGCVDYRNDNLFGALVFAPGDASNNSQNDGLMQLREIYGLDLSRCELAVLSACQTYAGPERPLEAGTSMARAFLEQGARRVVCSQWSTDDQATTDFMKAFFQAIRSARHAGRDVDYAQALHDAKRSLRGDSNRGSLPKYWSPFVLVGAY